MAVTVVEVLTEVESLTTTPNTATAIEVVSVTDGPLTTNTGTAVVDVASRPVVANAVVSETPPPNPFEGMVWIDIS
jgi:hypothetical protein